MSVGMTDHVWQPGEHTRYSPCGRHSAALDRLDFEAAVAVAFACSDCVVEFNTTTTKDRP